MLPKGVRIVHEDDDVIVVDKPTGLVTADPAAAAGAPRGMQRSAKPGQTLFDFIKSHVRERARRGMGRVWVVHRLDKEASGLVVFAKSERAFTSLKEAFRIKQVHRLYMAVAEGILGEPGMAGTRQSMIEEDRGPSTTRTKGHAAGPTDRRHMAITHYRVIATGNGRSLIQARLETGRKNQIRIHMQELGHPLVGDRRFGAATDAIGRLGLHAAELGFVHPATNLTIRYASPAPAAFYQAVGQRPPSEAGQSDAPDVGTKNDAPVRGGAHADTSWNEVADWYDTLLEDRGNDHYEQVILPGALELLDAKKGERVLDVACGQGILCRRLAAMGCRVVGTDAAPKLIQAARERSPEIEYHAAAAADLNTLGLEPFDHVSCVMALANIDPIEPALRAMAANLRPGGTLVIIMSHPAFRVPGQSDWGWDEQSGRQYRRIDAYASTFRREIAMHPGKAARGDRAGAKTTPTFHRSLQTYVDAICGAGMAITGLREWTSKRAASSGPRAPEENRARVEIPLFLGIRAERR